MRAPQIIFIVLMAMNFGVHAAKHGEPRDPYNIGWAALGVAVTVVLLYWGGFFG